MDWIDTHAHLDADAFADGRDRVLADAAAAGVGCVVIPAVAPDNFDAVAALAAHSGYVYALGVHPLYVDQAGGATALQRLRDAVGTAMADPRFVAIGEIGLDFHVSGVDVELQQWWYRQQLRLARDFDLPVLLHGRRAQDQLAAGLRQAGWGGAGPGGIAHAFNGSQQQADAAVALGLKLGFGGALTFDGSRNIRRLAATVADHALVLETDAPDMRPAWLQHDPNTPAQLPRIAQSLAALRGWSLEKTASQTRANALDALPRLRAWLDPMRA